MGLDDARWQAAHPAVLPALSETIRRCGTSSTKRPTTAAPFGCVQRSASPVTGSAVASGPTSGRARRLS